MSLEQVEKSPYVAVSMFGSLLLFAASATPRTGRALRESERYTEMQPALDPPLLSSLHGSFGGRTRLFGEFIPADDAAAICVLLRSTIAFPNRRRKRETSSHPPRHAPRHYPD